jgi:hypothetical protein
VPAPRPRIERREFNVERSRRIAAEPRAAAIELRAVQAPAEHAVTKGVELAERIEDDWLLHVAPPGPSTLAALGRRRYLGRMPVSDLEIARSAHQWISLHGENAVAKAREMVEAMRDKGDAEGADMWLRIIVAIGTLGEPPTDARHYSRPLNSAAGGASEEAPPWLCWRQKGAGLPRLEEMTHFGVARMVARLELIDCEGIVGYNLRSRARRVLGGSSGAGSSPRNAPTIIRGADQPNARRNSRPNTRAIGRFRFVPSQ